MSYAPRSFLELREYLQTETGLSATQLGIVGNAAHKSGYHLGRDRIYSTGGQGDNDYSVKTQRDRSGLTNAASAIDVGNYPGLRAMSSWLVSQTRMNAPDTRDIREIIYSPDGLNVYRFDSFTDVLYPGGDGTGQGDDSHLTHTHISYYRDAESRDKRDPFRRYFGALNMGVRLRLTGEHGSLAITNGTNAVRVSDGNDFRIPIDTTRDADGVQLVPNGSIGFVVNLSGDGPNIEQYFIRRSEPVVFTPTPSTEELEQELQETKALLVASQQTVTEYRTWKANAPEG